MPRKSADSNPRQPSISLITVFGLVFGYVSAETPLYFRHGSGQRCILSRGLSYCSGEPAKDLISLLMLCATLNDSATADVSSNPSPQVAVIIARWANFWGSPARDAAFSQRMKMLAESTAFTPGRVGTIP